MNSKEDRAGHQRQVRQAQERVILTALAVWPEGHYQIFHYEVAEGENEACWLAFFDHLIARGLDPRAVRLVVSDGANGLVTAMEQRLPQAQHQRCITHKVRRMERYPSFQHLPAQDAQGQALEPAQVKEARRAEIFQDAYTIYEAPTIEAAQFNLAAFIEQWRPLEPKAVHVFCWALSELLRSINSTPACTSAFARPICWSVSSANSAQRPMRSVRFPTRPVA
jgi:transposase-like protein